MLAEQLGFDRTMLGVPYSVLMFVSGIAPPAPLVAMLVMRKGVRFALVAGSLTLLAGESVHRRCSPRVSGRPCWGVACWPVREW